MTHAPLPPLPDPVKSPWVVLDWGVVRTLGKNLSPPAKHVTVIADVFAREAMSASGNYPAIRVANRFLTRLPAPFHVAVAREWHEFSVDDSSPTPPVKPRDICNEAATASLRSSLQAGHDAFRLSTPDPNPSEAKQNWPHFITELVAAGEQDKTSINALLEMTRNILDDPSRLLKLFQAALPKQIDAHWVASIEADPRGYPKFLFFAAMVFYAVQIHAKKKSNAKSIENDFDDLHYVVSAGITGHVCTAESSGGLGAPRLPDAIAHLYGDRVRVWTPGEWCAVR